MVLYHGNCYDGFGAAYAAWRLLGNEGVTYMASYHGNAPPLEECKGKVVVLLDYCFKMQQLLALNASCKRLLVIDHHQSARKELVEGGAASKGVGVHFDMEQSGAVLAWKYFHDAPVPRFLFYVEDRDLWRWKMPRSKEFTEAFRLVPMEFEAYARFEDDAVVEAALERGEFLKAATDQQVQRLARRATFMPNFFGYRVWILNSPLYVSEVGNVLAERDNTDFALIWNYDHRRRSCECSLRSTASSADVSEFAQFFNGGGHRCAAAFRYPGSIEILVNEARHHQHPQQHHHHHHHQFQPHYQQHQHQHQHPPSFRHHHPHQPLPSRGHSHTVFYSPNTHRPGPYDHQSRSNRRHKKN